MKIAPERLATVWRNLPQSTKILLAGLLLIAAITLWYVGLYLPAQMPPVAEPTPFPAQEATPKTIEAPPIPPLEAQAPPPPQVSASPKPAPTEAPKAEAPLPVPQPRTEPPLPNPFVPLVVNQPEAGPGTPPPPGPAPRPIPVPTGAPVRVSPGTPLPSPSLPSGTRPLPGSQGALPAPKVLPPPLKAEVPRESVENPPLLAAPPGLVESPLPQEVRAEGQTPQGPVPPTAKSPLQALVEEKGLKLAGTLLGPVSVAILESKEGYWVLPAGSTLPGSEAVIRRIEGDRVFLALNDENLALNLEAMQTGGGL